MLNITIFQFNNFDENTYVAVDKATGEGLVVDPGMLTAHERSVFDRFIEDNNINITQVVLTHGHLDHCFGANYVKNRYGVPVKIHAEDAEMASTLPEQGLRFGLGKIVKESLVIDVRLQDGDVIQVGESSLTVISVPGHSRGGIALWDKDDGVAFVGDSIFDGSIGRTDLPGGDFDTLVEALRNRILTLPDQTVLLPGHGPHFTVDDARRTNPYVKL